MANETTGTPEGFVATKSDEWRTFLLLAVVLAPALAVAIVGSYGFAIWMLQLIVGPPTG